MKPSATVKPKKAAPDSAILRLPGTQYHPGCRVVTWHPRGILDDLLADRIVGFIETEERIVGKPFHRFTDLSGLERINVGLDHVFEIAQRRKKSYRGVPVKSAFYAMRLIGLSIAQMYQELMQGSAIEVGVFRDRAAAAKWLGVPVEILDPPPAAWL